MESEPKTLQEPNLPGVPDCIPRRKGLEPDVATDDRAQARKRAEIDGSRDPAFDAPGGGSRDAARGPDGVAAETRSAPRAADLASDPPVVLLGALSSALGLARPGSHQRAL
jgi:hypothetical protein